jgi:hypothetical protein
LLLIGANPRAVELAFDQLQQELQHLLAKAFTTTTTSMATPTAGSSA